MHGTRIVGAFALLVLVALAVGRWSMVGSPLVSFLHAAGLAAGAGGGQDTDTDGDTMPDAWETFFGLDPNSAADATGDPDGDGLTNAQEYAARRHPLGSHARYFAEGSTGYFDTSMGILNLSETQTAHVALALLNEAGQTIQHQLSLGPRQRSTVALDTIPGVVGAVSIIVESDVPVAADRYMTWGTSGLGMSLDSGSPGPATTWYFAEGATGPFLLYYLFENPGPTAANVSVRYLIEGAPAVTRNHTLAPYSRTTVFVNADDPALANTSLGAVITSNVPILAERAMYVQSGGAFGGGAASSGSNSLSTEWFFGEGATGPFFNAFLSMVNPGTTAATATVTYHMSDGSTASKAYAIPAAGRTTVYLNAEAATAPALAPLAFGPVWFTVSSTQPILGERAMWWSTWPWYEGHAAPGSVATDLSWAVPEGRHGGTDLQQTYVLIGNASPSTAGQVRVTLIPDTGAPATRDFAIAAGERLTLNIGETFGLTSGRFSVIVDSLGAPGVPLTVDYARYRSVNGVPFSGGGAAPAVAASAAGDQAPSVSSSTPAANATGVAVDANLTVTFSEPVNVAPGAFTLECPASTPIALTNLTASPATTFTLDPTVDLPISTVCVLRINAASVTDVDTVDPPDTMAVDVSLSFTTSSCAAITITPSTSPVPGGTMTVLYGPITFSTTGNVDPVTYTISAGALPPGLNLSAAGVLDGTPTASGPYSFTVRAATVAGCAGSLPVTMAIASGPNEEPSFTVGPNPTVLEDPGPQTIANWATNISPGAPLDEAAQIVTFTVTGNTNAALFAVAPAVASNGTLTFTPAPNANGSATITLVAQDNGGTAIGGDDTSDPQNFTITVTPVNDAPSFTKGADQTVFENAGAQTVVGWATAIGTGPADEAGQAITTFTVTNNTNAALFSVAPAVAANGTLTFTTAADANGTATITLTVSDNGGTANGGVDTSATQTFDIIVTPVNSEPSFTTGADQTVLEDAGAQTVVGWATNILAGPPDEVGQTLTFSVTGNDNPTLFSVAPAVAADGTLTFTPTANTAGTATITLTLSDDGGTANGGIDTSSPAQTFTITVTGVNDAPSFTKGTDQTVLEESGAQTVAGWATAISAGPADEAGQTLTFNITGNTNTALFSAGPAVASNGTLTYTPAANAAGTATITLTLSDNGGTANGGVDTSASQTFDITITGINDVPSFTKGADQTVLEDAGAQTVNNWATSISAGPADEAGQTLTFEITNNTNAGLFSAGPAVAADGTLTYTPTTNTSGAATITLRIKDDGGTANGGVDTSATQTFIINVTDVNDAPSFSLSASHTSDEDAGAQSVSNFATSISAGGPGEGGQTLTFQVTNNTNPTLFSAAPSIASNGTLTYTALANAFGSATITVRLTDNGGTANGGVDVSPTQDFTITVNPVNDLVQLNDATINYATLGNTQLHVAGETLAGLVSIADAQSAFTKSGPTDVDGPSGPAFVPLTAQATPNGTITLLASGAFSYVPNANFTGTDTFNVQVTDGVTPVNVSVSIDVGPRVWYVSNLIDGNNSASGSDGRSNNAFETLAGAEGASSANDIIFVFNGASGSTPHTDGITLKNGQRLWGEGIGLTVAPFGTLVSAGTQPRIVTTSANGVTVLANTANGDRIGVEIRGLNIGSSGANAIDVTSANAANLGVEIGDNTVSGSGAALEGIDITQASTGTATLSVHDNTVTATGAGIEVFGGSGTTIITAFDDNVVTGDSVTAGILLSNLTFDAVPGGTLQTVSGGNTQIGASGNRVGTNGLVFFNVTGDLNFTTLGVYSDLNTAVSITGTGALGAVTGTGITMGSGSVIVAAAGAAVDLSNLTAAVQLTALTSTNSAVNGVVLTNVGGSFTAGAGSSITNASSADFAISGGAANVTYAGTITDDVGQLVSIASTTGGTKSFTGAITDGNDGDGSGISLTNNTGATITFAGGLLLSTGANPAFTATGGGTINVCDENPCNASATGGLVNTLTTTTGTALNVANTTIGANRLEFRSISANGAANGIVLNATGANGLIVTGAGGGGTIQNTTGDGVSLTNANNVVLTNLTINGTGTGSSSTPVGETGATDGHGIEMRGGSNLTLSGVQVLNAGDGDNEHGIYLFNVSGTVSVQGSTIADAEETLLHVDNTNTNMTLNVGTVTPSTFTHGAALASLGSFTGNGILFTPRGTSNHTINISNSTFNNIKLTAFQFGGDGTSAGTNNNITIDNNDFLTTVVNSPGNANNRANCVNIQGRTTIDIDASITNNVLDGGGGGGIQLGADQSSNIHATISGNTVSDQFADGILIGVDENAHLTVLIDNNIITNTSSDGMEIANAISPGGVSTLNATITNNTVTGHNNNAGNNAFVAGIAVFGGVEPADVTFIDIRNNNVSGNPNPGVYFDYFTQGFGDGITVEGPGTAAVDEAAFLTPGTLGNISGSPSGGRTFLADVVFSNGATVPLPVFTP